jgi:D-alanine-D-alanine ligase
MVVKCRSARSADEMKKKNLAVLFGGRSVEHEISVITALQLINVIDVTQYEIIPVYIAQTGRWYVGDNLLDKNFYRRLPNSLKAAQEVALLPIAGSKGLTYLNSRRNDVCPIDIYFLAFHGTFGEDGCIQGMLEMADATYTGCGVLPAALGMNKYQCKMMLKAAGIPVLPAALIDRRDAQKSLAAVREQIFATPGLEQLPLFVKPCNLGSSIGIGVAKDERTLNACLVNTFRYDSHAIVEPCVKDIVEVNVSVLDDDEITASVIEMPVSLSGVLTFEEKYLRDDGGKKTGDNESQGMASLSRVIDPQDLNPELKQAAVEYAKQAFKILGCSGVSRIDFIIDAESDRLYFNEINTLPGSLSFYLWVKSNPPLVYTELLNRIIRQAEKRQVTKLALKRQEGMRALFK